MAKRLYEETEAVSDLLNIDSNKGHRTKKSKVKATEGNDTGVIADARRNLSKEEQKERKESKKLKREKNIIGVENGAKESDKDEEIVDKAVVKAARKAEKLRKKLARDSVGHETNGAPTLEDVVEEEQREHLGDNSEIKTANKIVAKAERKAEKVRLRLLENPKRQKSNGKIKSGETTHPDKIREMASTSDAKPKLHSSYKEDPILTALPQSEIDTFLSTNFITITDPSTPNTLRPITDFSHLPKSTTPTDHPSPFVAFKTPTPIQSAAWPFLLSGRDVIGVAETGSGKTLAFGVPCIRALTTTLPSRKAYPVARAVMVSPTRELAVQIHDQLSALAKPAGFHSVCVYGGVPKDPQRLALRTAHIIVATPGRLNDLISEGSADLSGVTYLVLDEADRMLDKGFEDDIRRIISGTPSTAQGRQTCMFTATWPPSVRDLAATFMRQPVHISIGDNPSGELRANTRIAQLVEVVDPRSKEQRLLALVKQYQSGASKNDRILVFCLYKKEATRVEGFLRSRGLRVAGIHGDMSQVARSASLESFKGGECPLLVATDVAARGLDIPAVKLVINVTFPLTVEDYVHRIGRTGRAGAPGLAITLFTDHDKAQSGSLINVLRAANQAVPDELLKFGTTVKKKGHEAYGAFYKDLGPGEMKAATKIKFDD